MTPSSRSKSRLPSRKPESGQPFSLALEAIGTAWNIRTGDHLPPSSAIRLEGAIRARIEEFDATYSRFRQDSLVTRMASAAGRYRLPDDAGPMMSVHEQLYRLTDGLMTPLVGQLLADAGYDADYSLRPGRLSPAPAWDDVMTYAGGILTLQRPVLLDFGAAGKGYLADLVAGVMQAHGCQDFVIDAGGDIVRRGGGRLRVGLEHPANTEQAVGIAELGTGALCGSAGNRRSWAGFHHIIDPRRLESPRHIQALWVTAADGLTADALSTALFFVAPDRLAEFDFEYAIINSDMSLQRSPGFPANFFTMSDSASEEVS